MKNQPEHVTTVSGESLSDEIILPQILPQNVSKTRVDRYTPVIPKTKIVTEFLKQSPGPRSILKANIDTRFHCLCRPSFFLEFPVGKT